MNKWSKSKLFRLNIFPCQLCGTADSGLLGICPTCEQALPHNRSACRRCALPIPDISQTPICGQCLAYPPSCYQAWVPYVYAAPLDGLITGLKFRQQLHYAQLLGSLLAQHLQQNLHQYPECIVAVPLHPSRLRQRGYNQALELARPLARTLGIPLAKTLVQRVRPTRPQTELNLASRAANLHQAFRLKQAPDYQHIALVDDVITSGHTVNALAHAFRKQGVEKVEVWAIARAICRH